MVLDTTRLEDIWDIVLTRLEREINDKTVFNAYFSNTKIKSIDGDLVTLIAPSLVAHQVLNNKYIEILQDHVCDVTQTNFKVRVVDPNYIENNPLQKEATSEKEKVFISNLNPKYTFDNFVVGPSNREPYTAALATAMDPGGFYNPLFMYGKSGLGKTHLLHAIGNFIRSKRNNAKVLYLTTDDFFEDYVKAIKEREVENLKDRFREIDVLLLDDVQFLSTKEKTKETFFHIFNLLVNAGKQIVITSDRSPQELRQLEDRLVSRFQSGLSIEIKALEYETAYAILKKKVEAQDINRGLISNEVLEYIAKNYANDVRQLEGALNKLLFYAITYNQKNEIDMTIALETFKSFAKVKEKNTVNIDKIKLMVAEYYNISVSQLTSKLRTSNLTTARHIAMFLARDLLDLPLSKIGEEFGGRDHTTVINACEKVNNLLKEKEDYVVVMDELKKLIKS